MHQASRQAPPPASPTGSRPAANTKCWVVFEQVSTGAFASVRERSCLVSMRVLGGQLREGELDLRLDLSRVSHDDPRYPSCLVLDARSCSMSSNEIGRSESVSSVALRATPLTLVEVALQPTES